MRVVIETIPHSDQRYPTCGDYWVDADGTVQIRVSDMGNPQYERMVAIHELIELTLCEADGVTNEQIDAFDMGAGKDLDEPGLSDDAPYHHQHMHATSVEMALCSLMGLSWEKYDAAVLSLGES